MVLKTLKDLMDYDKDKELRNRIRQEAIKWVKEIAGIMYDDGLHYSSTWIKHFFNLTEEDLK